MLRFYALPRGVFSFFRDILSLWLQPVQDKDKPFIHSLWPQFFLTLFELDIILKQLVLCRVFIRSASGFCSRFFIDGFAKDFLRDHLYYPFYRKSISSSARVAKLANALDLGSSSCFGIGGSSPPSRTNRVA